MIEFILDFVENSHVQGLQMVDQNTVISVLLQCIVPTSLSSTSHSY